MNLNPWIVLVSVAALIFYLSTALAVARLRKRYDVPAPAMTGHPVVERALRVQGNTLEWLVMFLPALWMFWPFWGAYLGAALGVVWIVGRIIYMASYLRSPDSRTAGFVIQGLVTLILIAGDVAGALRALSVS